MHIRVSTYSNIGDRPVNEDFMLTRRVQNRLIFALADGLGGHGRGDEASRFVCQTAVDLISKAPVIDDGFFSSLYEQVQSALLAKQKELEAVGSMRTTLNLLVIEKGTAWWNHIGDSRTYLFEDGKIVKRTFDHSVSQMMVALGEIDETQIRFHEDRNRLLKVLGADDVRPAFESEQPVKLKAGQQFLLCSDGFWNLITEEQILLCLEEAEEPQLWIDNMAELVNRNGSHQDRDNITAIAVWIAKD